MVVQTLNIPFSVSFSVYVQPQYKEKFWSLVVNYAVWQVIDKYVCG